MAIAPIAAAASGHESVLHQFTGGGDGGFSLCNGAYCGTIFELSPVSGGWAETILFNFAYWNGAYPSGVTMDSKGALYGTAEGNEIKNFGTVFEFVP